VYGERRARSGSSRSTSCACDPSREWERLQAGLATGHGLTSFILDVTGPEVPRRTASFPPEIVLSRRSTARAPERIPPRQIFTHVVGTTSSGTAPSDTRARGQLPLPSGVSYVLENRNTLNRVFRSSSSTTRSASRTTTLLPTPCCNAARASARSRCGDPHAGMANSAYFENSFPGPRMGVVLVEGRD